MSFERHHPHRQIDRNLARARDLRSAYLLACFANIPEFIARMWRIRRGSRPPRLELPAHPAGNQGI